MQLQADKVERDLNFSRDLPAYKAMAKQIDDDEPTSQSIEKPHLDDPPQDIANTQISDVNQDSRYTAETSPGNLEHYLVRGLPMHGLFCEDVPRGIAPEHFFTRYEACRVALGTRIPVTQLLSNYNGGLDDYDVLWSHFGAIVPHRDLPKRTHPKTWNGAITRSPDVTLTGSLSFNSGSSDGLFRLRLEPLQSERSCRFHRAFGSDRFLYLNVPSLRSPPKELQYLKGQEKALAQRYLQWLATEHKFLGRTWRVVMVETKQSKKTARQPNAKSGQRLILFATDGVDIRQPSHSYNLTAPHAISRQSLYQAINWFLPIHENLDQSFCKAYSRLELGQRAVTFVWDQAKC